MEKNNPGVTNEKIKTKLNLIKEKAKQDAKRMAEKLKAEHKKFKSP